MLHLWANRCIAFAACDRKTGDIMSADLRILAAALKKAKNILNL